MPIFSETVRFRMSEKDVNRHYPIGITFYDYEKDVGEINAIITTSRLPGIEPDNAEKDKTINDFLAEMNRKVCQDAVKVKNMPPVMQTFETYIDNPHLDGEYDHLRTRAEKTKYELKIPEIVLREINDNFEREGKRTINDIKGVVEKKDGTRDIILEYGVIDQG